MKAHISFRPHGQKTKNLFTTLLTPDILEDICRLTTGQDQFDLEIAPDDSPYNKGRLVIVEFDGWKHYVTLSETTANGRNSTVQSAPSVLNQFVADPAEHKTLNYYFLNHTGNLFTSYLQSVYKLLMTVGFKFLNIDKVSNANVINFTDPNPFGSIDELITYRNKTKKRNKSNNSSYVTKSEDAVQVYAKTYGASKYESTLMAIAALKIAKKRVEIYTITEGELKNLPKASLKTIKKIGDSIEHGYEIHNTSLTFDRRKVEGDAETLKLRDACYIFNLLERIGAKKCALCGCEIPEIIQGAHIWPVASIRKADMPDEDKFKHATSGHNGIWLCQNHHKLFDSNIIFITNAGTVRISRHLLAVNKAYIASATPQKAITNSVLSAEFKDYADRRNGELAMTETESF